MPRGRPLLEEIAKGLPFEMHQNHVEEFLSVFDLDHNGLISREEFLNFTKVTPSFPGWELKPEKLGYLYLPWGC